MSNNENRRGGSSFDQPYIEVNEVNNQEIYISRGKRAPVNVEVEQVTKEIPTPKNKEKNYAIAPMEEVIEEESIFKGKKLSYEPVPLEEALPRIEPTDELKETHQTSKAPKISKKKPFKQLTIDEKIDYLQNYPTLLPPVYCFYQLDTFTVQGKLEEVTETELIILQKNQTQKTIERKSIKNILLPGLGS